MAKLDAKRRDGQRSRRRSIDAVFLASDESGVITDIELFADGGTPQV